MVQMLGWFRAEAAGASRRKRARAGGSWATSSGRNLRATKRRSDVLGLVNDAHSAAAQLLDDAVMRDRSPNHQAQILRGSKAQVNESFALLQTAQGRVGRAGSRFYLPESFSGNIDPRFFRCQFDTDQPDGFGHYWIATQSDLALSEGSRCRALHLRAPESFRPS